MNRRFLLLGCGSIGQRHLSNLRNLGVRDIGVYDPDRERASRVAQEFKAVRFATLEEALGEKPNVALVCAPTNEHLPLALQAAREKCHLFIEKPLSDSREGVKSLLSLVRENQLVSLVGCNMRFHPCLRKVKSLLNQNVLGRVVAARIEVGQYLPDWHPAEDYRKGYSAQRARGGGVVLDATHELDYARWLFGRIHTVAGFCGTLSRLSIDTEDTAGILLRFESGMIGEVHVDYVQRSYSRSLHIIGEEGTLRWEWGKEVRLYSAGTKDWVSFPMPTPWDVNVMYQDEMRHFIQCLDLRAEPEQDVVEAAEVLDVALAVKSSSKEGRFMTIRP